MGIFELTIATLLGLVGLGLALFFIWALASPCFGWILERLEQQRLAESLNSLTKLDQCVASGKFDEAIELLRRVCYLDLVVSENSLVKLQDLYQNFLSRVVLIANEINASPDFLPETEALLSQRIELIQLYRRVKNSYNNFLSKRERRGKDLPAWGKLEFEQKVTEARNELTENKESLQIALNKLIESLVAKDSASTDIVYH
jgi:hypothetical protein